MAPKSIFDLIFHFFYVSNTYVKILKELVKNLDKSFCKNESNAKHGILRRIFWIMPIPGEVKLIQKNNPELSSEERLDVAMQLLKGLNPLKEMADAEGFELLSYLLRMAVIEVQSIASGTGESYRAPCEVCGFSYEVNSLSEGDDTSL